MLQRVEWIGTFRVLVGMEFVSTSVFYNIDQKISLRFTFFTRQPSHYCVKKMGKVSYSRMFIIALYVIIYNPKS